MIIKSFIEKYSLLSSELSRLQAEINGLIKEKANAYDTLKAYAPTDVPSKKSGVSDPVANAVEGIIDNYGKRIEFYARRINRIIDEKAFFDDLWCDPSILTHQEKFILSLRYFEDLTWENVSIKLSYSVKQCHRIHNKAIHKLQTEADRRLQHTES